MSEYRTDEESIELIRNWWKENGTFLLVGIVVVVGLVLGWQAWQRYQIDQRAQASDRFLQFRDAVKADSRTPATMRALLLQQLKEGKGGSGYGAFAALLEAKRLVDHADFDAAIKELDWVVHNAKSPDLADLARIRMARVVWAKGDIDGALKALDGIDSRGYASMIDELRGDLLFAKGDRAGAHAAYQRAIVDNSGATLPVVEIKRDDVAPAKVADVQTSSRGDAVAAPAGAAAHAAAPSASSGG